MGKQCFSQWFPSPFTVDSLTYHTAEHYMMCEKARLFGDAKAIEQILDTKDPGKAKYLGRTVTGFSEEIWNQRRFDIVVQGNHFKFSQDPVLKDYLIKTGKRVLVEASPKDRIWGIGLAEDDPRCQNPNLWKGLNLLGFALMKVRSELMDNTR